MIKHVWVATRCFCRRLALPYSLHGLGMMFSAWLSPGAGMDRERNARLRAELLRWIGAVHVLGMEDLQGLRFTSNDNAVLTPTEYNRLAREKKRATRVVAWITQA